MMQLTAGVKKNGLPIKVVHTMQLLDWAYAQTGN